MKTKLKLPKLPINKPAKDVIVSNSDLDDDYIENEIEEHNYYLLCGDEHDE